MRKKVTKLEPWQLEDADRLNTLFRAKSKLSQADFGAMHRIGSQGMVWQYLHGHRALNIKAADAFARGLCVSIDQFSPTIAQQISMASRQVGDSHELPWPLPKIDEGKVRSLSGTEVAELQAAIVIAAAQLGLDVKKD